MFLKKTHYRYFLDTPVELGNVFNWSCFPKCFHFKNKFCQSHFLFLKFNLKGCYNKKKKVLNKNSVVAFHAFEIPLCDAALVGVLAPRGAARCLRATFPRRRSIHWRNDLTVGRRKYHIYCDTQSELLRTWNASLRSEKLGRESRVASLSPTWSSARGKKLHHSHAVLLNKCVIIPLFTIIWQSDSLLRDQRFFWGKTDVCSQLSRPQEAKHTHGAQEARVPWMWNHLL